jgi:hypothetical protein
VRRCSSEASASDGGSASATTAKAEEDLAHGRVVELGHGSSGRTKRISGRGPHGGKGKIAEGRLWNRENLELHTVTAGTGERHGGWSATRPCHPLL